MNPEVRALANVKQICSNRECRSEDQMIPGQRYCRPCHAAYMREWRKTHPLNPEQRKKDAARSYAGVYKRRGLLEPQPCPCGSEAEMHHPDYDQPLKVEWMCRPCHLEHHQKVAA
jgi:hypothetical protein